MVSEKEKCRQGKLCDANNDAGPIGETYTLAVGNPWHSIREL